VMATNTVKPEAKYTVEDLFTAYILMTVVKNRWEDRGMKHRKQAGRQC